VKGIEKIVKGAMQDAEREIEREKVMKADWDQAPEWATMFGLAGIKEMPVWYNLQQYQHTSGAQCHRIFAFHEGCGYPIHAIQRIEMRPAKPDPREWRESIVDRIGELGNQVHNLGCDWQNDEDISDELSQISVQLWEVQKQAYIRTQAEREREDLASLCRAKFNQHTPSSNPHLWKQVADAILAAGWRKED